jgi:hypothetical protein
VSPTWLVAIALEALAIVEAHFWVVEPILIAYNTIYGSPKTRRTRDELIKDLQTARAP